MHGLAGSQCIWGNEAQAEGSKSRVCRGRLGYVEEDKRAQVK